MLELPAPIVSVEWLEDALASPSLCLVDCRFRSGDPSGGVRLYRQGHLPGAAFLDLDRDLSGPPGPQGRHPLPDPQRFAAAARRAGIGAEKVVVAYDQGMAGGASRLWWLLRHFGHTAVAVLDGGIADWKGELEVGDGMPTPPGDLVPVLRGRDALDATELLERLADRETLIVDARAAERFRGEHEPIDPVAGHIPGAVNVPFSDPWPLPASLIQHRGEVVAYCGSGVTATVLLLALAVAGRDDALLYPGSWSEWCTRGLPVATGPTGSIEA